MGWKWGPSGADRTQVGPMMVPWNLLSAWSKRRRTDTSTKWNVDKPKRWQTTTSTNQNVDLLFCRRFGLARFWFGDVLDWRRFGLSMLGLSTFWLVIVTITKILAVHVHRRQDIFPKLKNKDSCRESLYKVFILLSVELGRDPLSMISITNRWHLDASWCITSLQKSLFRKFYVR